MQKIFIMILILAGASARPKKIRYISTEHPTVTYYNTKYVNYVNLTAQRYGRRDPFYYVGLNMDIIGLPKNNITVDFYFYEILTNQYKRKYFEMHFKLCDLVEKDNFFGTGLRQAGLISRPCPFSPGVYNLNNMTIPIQHIPENFPFTTGRIYCNTSVAVTKELIVSAYIDMEIKEARIKQ